LRCPLPLVILPQMKPTSRALAALALLLSTSCTFHTLSLIHI